MLLGQADDKAEVDMDTDAPQVSHKPGGEPKIKVSFPVGFFFSCIRFFSYCQLINAEIISEAYTGDKYFFCICFWRNIFLFPFKCKFIFERCFLKCKILVYMYQYLPVKLGVFTVSAERCT